MFVFGRSMYFGLHISYKLTLLRLFNYVEYFFSDFTFNASNNAWEDSTDESPSEIREGVQLAFEVTGYVCKEAIAK